MKRLNPIDAFLFDISMEKENWNNVEIDEDEDEFEWKWQAMRSKGCTEEEIQKEKQKQRYKDDIYLYKQIIASKAWETDCSCTFAMSYIHLSYAYDGLNNRNEALNTLKLGHSLEPHEHKLTLALAKLLFRADFKLQAFELCVELYERYALQQSILSSKSRGDWNEEESTAMTSLVMSEDVSDAYYLAGESHLFVVSYIYLFPHCFFVIYNCSLWVISFIGRLDPYSR